MIIYNMADMKKHLMFTLVLLMSVSAASTSEDSTHWRKHLLLSWELST